MSHHDAIVVGAGLAGLMAASRLADAGARVLVLAKGVGSTHLTGGTVDVLGYAPERVPSPRTAVEALIAERPDHPYARVGAAGVAAALDAFAHAIGEGPLAPYAYVGGMERNVMLPTAVGVLKPSAMVPATMAAGDLGDGATTVCVVGFRVLKDFHAPLLADNLERAGSGLRARAIELDLVPEGRADVNAQGFARGFDDPAFRAQVGAQVAARLRGEERVAFPAVLGLADPHGIWTELEHRLGRPVFEVSTLPPSVPGLRLWAVLRERLRRAGVRVILNAQVTGHRAEGGRVRALVARVGLREGAYGTDWVVLATGGFASGGIDLDSRWQVRETALGLPLAGAPRPGEPRFDPAYFGEHPMTGVGVRTDEDLRPCDEAGERVLDNVLVAGASLAGAAPWREKSGDGISIATGWRAAQEIIGARAGAAAGAAAG